MLQLASEEELNVLWGQIKANILIEGFITHLLEFYSISLRNESVM